MSEMAFPPVGRCPRCIALLRERMSRRAQAQDVQQQSLVIAFPPVAEKAAFRLPAVRDGVALVLRPSPISAAVKGVGEGPDLTFAGCIGVEIGPRRQCAGQQKSAVDGREFAMPGAAARLHVEKMIVEPLVASGVGLSALRAVPEKAQCRKRSLYRRGPGHESAFHTDWVARQGKSSGGDAGRPIHRSLVNHEAIGRVGFMQKIVE